MKTVHIITILYLFIGMMAFTQCGGGEGSGKAEAEVSITIEVGGAASLEPCGDSRVDAFINDVKAFYNSVATPFDKLREAMQSFKTAMKVDVEADIKNIQAYFSALTTQIKEKLAGAKLNITINVDLKAEANATGTVDESGATGEASASAEASAEIVVELYMPGSDTPELPESETVKAIREFFVDVIDVGRSVVAIKEKGEELRESGSDLVKNIDIKDVACSRAAKEAIEYVKASNQGVQKLLSIPKEWSAELTFTAEASASAEAGA
jgi:hypothetical protein